MGQLILNRKCYQVSKPEMELRMIDMKYAALPMRAQTEKTTFSCKDNQCKALHNHGSGGKGLVHWRRTHGAGHIPGIFSLNAAYSALRHFCIETLLSKRTSLKWFLIEWREANTCDCLLFYKTCVFVVIKYQLRYNQSDLRHILC